LKGSSIPFDLVEAKRRNSLTGKFLSSRMVSIILPTAPVAPTTATVYSFISSSKLKILDKIAYIYKLSTPIREAVQKSPPYFVLPSDSEASLTSFGTASQRRPLTSFWATKKEGSE
jgi:hypothetical protein